MSFGGIVVLALGLAMDATAAAGAKGLAARRIRLRDAVVTGLYFGSFQGLMPVLGWVLGRFLGARAGATVAAWDHWIAFVLLTAIGGKMLWDARGSKAEERTSSEEDLFGFRHMITLAVATSIDAFAVGVTLPMLGAPLLLAAATIGTVTALLSAAGVYAGRRFGAMLGRRLDAIGGLVLIGMGTKILLEHLNR